MLTAAIEQHTFFFAGDYFIAPSIRRRFSPNIFAENNERIFLMAISVADFSSGVSTAVKARKNESNRSPLFYTRPESFRRLRGRDLRSQEQAKRRNDRKDAIDALGWNDRH